MTAFFNNNHIIEQVFSNTTLFEFDILSSILESDANYRLNNELIEFEKLQLINFNNFLTSHFIIITTLNMIVLFCQMMCVNILKIS